ncbi:hypothetical protein GmHk_11G032545 [Glycine max]|nr:hypothetical protein GmHk_11G032545 [Glycine max]
MQMADRGRGGGRRIFNRGTRRGFSLGAPITTNPSPSSIHISSSESMVHVVAQTPNTLPTTQDQPNPTFVRESIPTTPVRDASPSAPDDSVTPEYPPDPNCEHIVDERPFIRAYKGEFQPTYGCSNIIWAKFDEPAPSWLKVSVDLCDSSYFIFYAERVGGTHKKSELLELFLRQKVHWITTNVRAGLEEHWGSTDFLNKSSTAKANRYVDRGASAYSVSKEFQRPPTAWEVMEKTNKFEEKYQHRRDEILQRSTEEDTSTQDSPNTVTSVNDNEIYLNVVGGPNYKGNVYDLGTLSKRFSCSKLAPSTSIAHSIIIKQVKM